MKGKRERRISRLETEILLSHVLGVSRSYIQTWPQIIEESKKQQFESLLARRKQGEPIAYLTGMKEFWSLPFMVSPDVLIPRPETESLVELALVYGGDKGEAKRVLDLGTGSGAIALALAVEHSNWEMIAVDKSISALQVALQNAKNLSVHNVQFYLSDWFSHFSHEDKKGFDLIIANPPYISPQDLHLTDKALQYEPKEALISIPDGLQDLRQIITKAPNYLASQGWLMLEHGFNQKAFVCALMQSTGFVEIQSFQDLSDLDRVTIGRKS